MARCGEISNKSESWCFFLRESITLKLELNRVQMCCAPNSHFSRLQYFLSWLVTEPGVRRSSLPSLPHLFIVFYWQSQDARASVEHVYTPLWSTHTNIPSLQVAGPNSGVRAHTHTHKHAHERTRRTVLSPWLSRAICLSPPSPLTAAACPGQLRASQKSPSAIQQHINLLKSQPFQKGRRHSNLSAVVRGNIISLSQIHDSVTSALDDMKSEGGGEEASAFSFLLISFSFSPLISCLWVLSLKAILCLCPSFHICMNTVAFQSAQWVAPQPGLAQRSGWSGID